MIRVASLDKGGATASIKMLGACLVTREPPRRAMLTLHAQYFLLLLQSEETLLRKSNVVRPEGLEPPTPRSVVDQDPIEMESASV